MSTQHVVTVALAADGRSWVDGTELPRAADGTLAGARAAALAEVARIASAGRRPVRVAATDPDGEVWRFVVAPDGNVYEPTATVPQPPDDPDALHVPAEYEAAVAEIVTAMGDGREHHAMAHARRLEEKAAAEHGEGHPSVLRALELRAHAAFAAQMPGVASELYVQAALGWHALGSTQYWTAVKAAYATWLRMGPEPTAAWLGDQLVAALELGGAATAPTVRAVLARVDEVRLRVA